MMFYPRLPCLVRVINTALEAYEYQIIGGHTSPKVYLVSGGLKLASLNFINSTTHIDELRI